MNSNETSNGDFLDNFNSENNASVDDFIKQLEEKEKDLDISSDLVIEVGESDVEHDNIHDSFVPNGGDVEIPESTSMNGEVKTLPTDDFSKDSEIKLLEEKIKRLTAEREQLSEKMRRRQMDFDNYKNRNERERKETFKNVLCSLATQMLPVLDNLNRALDVTSEAHENGEKDFQKFLEGIVLVNQQLNEVLAGMGVQPIAAVGQPFNPAFHEAVASEQTNEHPSQTVIEELLRGYRLDDKIIRASMVKVSA